MAPMDTRGRRSCSYQVGTKVLALQQTFPDDPSSKAASGRGCTRTPEVFPIPVILNFVQGTTEDLNLIDDEETQLSMCKGAL